MLEEKQIYTFYNYNILAHPSTPILIQPKAWAHREFSFIQLFTRFGASSTECVNFKNMKIEQKGYI